MDKHPVDALIEAIDAEDNAAAKSAIAALGRQVFDLLARGVAALEQIAAARP